MTGRVLFFLLITTFCRAQVPGKTLVFKARAPATECSIICKENFFWLETENPVQIKVKGARNIKTKVEVTGGKIVSIKDDIYYILFTRPGTAVISVYQNTMYGRELVATKKLPIKNPDIYFLDIKLDSVSKFFRLRGANVYAYSHYYKKRMDIVSFEMYYIADTTRKIRKKVDPVRMKSDTCMITPEMKKYLLNFQPKYNSIYLHNIVCRVPDGSKRILDPIQLNVEVDTTNKEKLSLMYSVKRKIF